jgi:hypothetical protein
LEVDVRIVKHLHLDSEAQESPRWKGISGVQITEPKELEDQTLDAWFHGRAIVACSHGVLIVHIISLGAHEGDFEKHYDLLFRKAANSSNFKPWTAVIDETL